jgi:hypothetical protein
MTHHIVTATLYTSEFKAEAFGRPSWRACQLEEQTHQHVTMGTVVQDLQEYGWRELGKYDMKMAFPCLKSFNGAPVDRMFVSSVGGSRMGMIMVLSEGEW